MSTNLISTNLNRNTGFTISIVMILLLAFSTSAWAQHEDYQGSEACQSCHEQQYKQWKASGHPYMLMEAERSSARPIPLPEGMTLDDVTYTVGGFGWKALFLGEEGYIVTSVGSSGNIDGQNQWNVLTGEWVDNHAGEMNKPYTCGRCHTTGWIADEDADTDGDLSDNQDMLPGIHGIFAFGGVHCEQCHGTDHPGEIDPSAEACGDCHVRGSTDELRAQDGFIQNHAQYNELLAGAHGNFDCVRCHNPHQRSDLSLVRQCSTCHSGTANAYAETVMADYGVSCEDCHMPLATKSGQELGPFQGDMMSHIYYINTDPNASMFSEDGSQVVLDDNGKAAVTLDFACKGCHQTASMEELSKWAKNFHDLDGSLENFGFDPGISGVWWKPDRSGEGFVIEAAYAGGAPFMFASFYTYDDMGNQVYLVANSNSVDGTTVNVDVFITTGRKWGDDFDPNDGETVPWGTGTFSFPTCTSGSFTLVPNADAIAAGFTELTYELQRILEPGIRCPTFVNNAN